MKNYVVYNSQGVILKTGYCPTDMLALQAGNGESVIEGQANEETDLVDVTTNTVLKNVRNQ